MLHSSNLPSAPKGLQPKFINKEHCHHPIARESRKAINGADADYNAGPHRMVKEVVEAYALGAREKFSGMIFTKPQDPNDAMAFLSFLKLLGLKMYQIKFIRYDITS